MHGTQQEVSGGGSDFRSRQIEGAVSLCCVHVCMSSIMWWSTLPKEISVDRMFVGAQRLSDPYQTQEACAHETVKSTTSERPRTA